MADDDGRKTPTPPIPIQRGHVIPDVRIESVERDNDGAGSSYGDDILARSPESAGAAAASDDDLKRNSAAGRWLLVRSHIHKELPSYDSAASGENSGANSPLDGPGDPKGLINLIQSGPSVQSYTRLKRQLKRCDRQWILRFLELSGLELLYVSLQRLCANAAPGRPGRRSLSIADAFAQIECVACFKAVMDSQAGLDYIIEDTEFTRKLANGESYLTFFLSCKFLSSMSLPCLLLLIVCKSTELCNLNYLLHVDYQRVHK
ncbi:uncharacterized protein LOC129260141 [Lytechinus pictus]|uniref:uncharacterized protein LOC129260141 n=1 Tax=Lytechinus pictus TaxID=7653 RepID=UPI00240CF60C|nr:uncharacterized protein LOC129260141 [Lytechinus pictus]